MICYNTNIKKGIIKSIYYFSYEANIFFCTFSICCKQILTYLKLSWPINCPKNSFQFSKKGFIKITIFVLKLPYFFLYILVQFVSIVSLFECRSYRPPWGKPAFRMWDLKNLWPTLNIMSNYKKSFIKGTIIVMKLLNYLFAFVTFKILSFHHKYKSKSLNTYWKVDFPTINAIVTTSFKCISCILIYTVTLLKRSSAKLLIFFLHFYNIFENKQ